MKYCFFTNELFAKEWKEARSNFIVYMKRICFEKKKKIVTGDTINHERNNKTGKG